MHAVAINAGNKQIYHRYASFMLQQLSTYDLDVVVMTIDDDNLNQDITEEWKRRNPRTRIADMQPFLAKIYMEKSIPSHYSRATFLKLAIPFSPAFEGYDKVLYLDTDMLILGDIRSIFEMNMENSFFGMVEDYNMTPHGVKRHYLQSIKGKYTRYGIVDPGIQKYHNAGLVLLNMDFIRANIEDYGCRLQNLMRVYYLDPWEYADQDLVNLGFSITTLPDRFNKLRGYSPRAADDVILHFISVKNDFDSIVSSNLQSGDVYNISS